MREMRIFSGLDKQRPHLQEHKAYIHTKAQKLNS